VSLDGASSPNRGAGVRARFSVLRGRPAGLGGKLDRARPKPCGIRVEAQDQLRLARGDLLRKTVAEEQRYSLTAFFSPAPAVNLGTREAAMWIR
jgi:hypothetical protein